MADYFFDASALVKYYFVEAGSAWVVDLVDTVAADGSLVNRIYVCDITTVEVASALAILHRTGLITKRQRDDLVESFWRDMHSRYNVVPLRPDTLMRAARLTQQNPLKAYDAVQLASGLSVSEVNKTLGLTLIFITSDKQLLAAALSEKLAAENPLNYRYAKPEPDLARSGNPVADPQPESITNNQ